MLWFLLELDGQGLSGDDVVLVELGLEPVAECLALAVGLDAHIMQCHCSVGSLKEHGGLSWSGVRFCLNERHHDPCLNDNGSVFFSCTYLNNLKGVARSESVDEPKKKVSVAAVWWLEP